MRTDYSNYSNNSFNSIANTDSETLFNDLFDKNPTPMFIYDINTLNFLFVNKAAVNEYGYSLDEFNNMTLLDICTDEYISSFLENLNNTNSTIRESRLFEHKKKNGEIILVKISSNSIRYNGHSARFVMTLDITEKVISKQNLVNEIAKLKNIIESTTDKIFLLDRNYCYTSYNSSHAAIMKELYNVDIEIGKSMLEYFTVLEDRINAKRNIDIAFEGETVKEITIAGNRKYAQRYFEIVHNPIWNENNEVIGVSVFAKDITEQKNNDEKVKQLSHAIEQSPVTVFITDTDGNIEYINSKGLDITGYTSDELIGNNPRILSSGEKNKEDYKELWETIKAGKTWKGEFHNRKKSGELYWESATISPIYNETGTIIKFLAVKEDISDRKKSEAELIAAKEKAEEINRIKTAFFANMSHELRTPLVGILGFADILNGLIEDDEQKSMASSILNSGKRLLNTLTSLLNLTELETLKERVDLSECNVNLICEDVFNSFKKHSANEKLRFNSALNKEPLKLKINERLFRESLTQIIKNAETYTEYGFILLTTYIKAMPSSGIKYGVIEIADTGIGIPDEKLDLVFEEFRQVSEGIGRDFEGTGLGLTLAKKYIELMGGKIELKSRVNNGTRVSISFQIQEETLTDISTVINDANNTAGNKSITNSTNQKINNILIVEDDDITRLFVQRCVLKIGKYKAASNGKEAILAASQEKFDLILMDINLGNNSIDGLTTVELIRQNPDYKNTPIVAMTAYTEFDIVERLLKNGFSHYISKPFLTRELTGFIKNILVQN